MVGRGHPKVPVYVTPPKTMVSAFGENLVAGLTPQIQMGFFYGVNNQLVETQVTNNGTVSSEDSLLILKSPDANSSSTLLSKDFIHYQPGQGSLSRFSSLFSTAQPDSNMEAGVGNYENFFGFGYENETFGIIRKNTGSKYVIPQSEWNVDKMDGKGPSGQTLNPQAGNIFQIKNQWLGYGGIQYFIESATTSEFQLVHTERYANKNEIPSSSIPHLQFTFSTRNGTNSNLINLKSSSIAGFVEGQEEVLGLVKSSGNITTVSDSFKNILTVRNNPTFKGKTNLSVIRLDNIGIATDGTKSVTVKLIKNALIGGSATYTNIDVDTSLASIMKNSATATDGDYSRGYVLAKVDSRDIDLIGKDIRLLPNETLSVVGKSKNSSEVTIDLTWVDWF